MILSEDWNTFVSHVKGMSQRCCGREVSEEMIISHLLTNTNIGYFVAKEITE